MKVKLPFLLDAILQYPKDSIISPGIKNPGYIGGSL